MHIVVKEGSGVKEGRRLQLTRAPESCLCVGVGAVGQAGASSVST